MFSGIKRIFGVIDVKVKDGVVIVEGIPSEVIVNDIQKIWKTSRVSNNLFISIGTSSFSFYEFFCVELVYSLKLLIEDRKTKANRRTLNEIVTKLETETWLARLSQPVVPILNRDKLQEMTLTPLPPQQGFFNAYETQKYRFGLTGGLLAGAAGSGKTFMSLALMNMLECDLVIVVCPANAVTEVWEENINSKFKTPQKFWSSTSKRPPVGDERFLIFTFEAIAKISDIVKDFSYKKLGTVLDESHNFNELKSLRTQRFIALMKELNCQDVLWSSGTPIKAITIEAIPLIRTIDPLFTPECEESFKAIYGVSSQRANDMLAHRLEGVMYKIEKKELGLIEPILREIKVKVPNGERFTLERIRDQMAAFTQDRLDYYAKRRKDDEKFFYAILDEHYKKLGPAERAEYQNYARNLATVIRFGGDARACASEMIYCNRYENRTILPRIESKADRDVFKDTKSIIKYVRLKVQGECLGRVVGRARIDAHVAMARFVNYPELMQSTENKVLVYTSFIEVIEALKAHFTELELHALFVYAETNKNLSSIISTFSKDKTANPLVATYKSLSTAVPLTMADVVIMVDTPWRDYQLQQTIARVSRLGATTQKYIYTCTLDTGDKPNISTRSVDILKWSQQQVAAITGIRSPFELTDDMEQVNLALEGLDTTNEVPVGVTPAFLSW